MAGVAAGRLGSSSDAHLSVVSWAQCKGGLLTDVEHLIIQMQTHTQRRPKFLHFSVLHVPNDDSAGGQAGEGWGGLSSEALSAQ